MLHAGILIERHTVTIHSTTVTGDDYGDSTEETTDRDATGILFAPEGLAESTSSDAPRVLGTATLYGNTGHLSADDAVEHAEACGCGGTSFPYATWQVVGGSKGWGGANFAVPIKRAAGS